MYFFEQILYEDTTPVTSKPQSATKSQKVQDSSTPPAPAPVPSFTAAQAKQLQTQPLTKEQEQAQAEAHAHHAKAVATQAEIQAQQAESLAQKGQSDIPDDFDFSESDVDEDQEPSDGDISQDKDSTLIPIKRYYLIQKLFALNDKMNELRIKNDVLSLVISFIDSFSYESLLALTNKFVEEIYLQVKDKSELPKDKTTV